MAKSKARLISLRRQVLEEWRGLPGEPEGPTRCFAASDLLKSVLAKLGLEENVAEEQMREEWRTIVGEFIACHSEPVSLRRGVLTIGVLQPTVRYELDRAWRSVILEKLRARFGARKILQIRFR